MDSVRAMTIPRAWPRFFQVAGVAALASFLSAPAALPQSRQIDGIPIFVDKPPSAKPAAKIETLRGTNEFLSRGGAQASDRRMSGDIKLDFADAEIREVVRAILGDILQLSYSVDPQVTGKITLKSAGGLSEKGALAALETALRSSNAILVKTASGYSVVPLTDASRRTSEAPLQRGNSGDPGYGIEAVTLRFVSASELQKVLAPLAPQGAIVSIDASRNLIFIAGASREREALLETIRMFDVDYLRATSLATYRPKHASPSVLAAELKPVIDRPNSPSAGLVQLIPIDRINALLIVSLRRAHLQSALSWAEKLDAAPAAAVRQVYYYRLQNVKVQDVAPTLAAVWGAAQAVQRPPQRSVETLNSTAQPQEASGFGEVPGPGGVAPLPVAAAPPVPPAATPALTASLATGGSEGPQIIPDEAANALIIRANKSEYETILRFLREIDVTPAQVMIEATIAEVTLNDRLRYGVEWFFKLGDSNFDFSKTGTPTAQFPGFAYSYITPNVEVVLNALAGVTDVSVISSPKIFTLDNRPALLQVGDQVPIITQSATGIIDTTRPAIVNSVQLRDTGIVLRVTPRIGAGGTVFVDVKQEVSEAVQTTSSGIDSPTIRQRRIDTEIAVQDGETVALGGIMRKNSTDGRSGVPILMDIPVVGDLFSSNERTSERTELLIFLRPRIVRNPAESRALAEEMRAGMRSLQQTLGGMNGKGDAPIP